MTPNKKGQMAKLNTPLPDGNPNQLYVVLEVFEDDESPIADIQALNSSLSVPPINTVRLTDLEVVEDSTQELIGHNVTINKSDYSQVSGKVIRVNEQKIILNLGNGIRGVETNIWITIVDKAGKEHMGSLYVEMNAK
jgi:hypothetical protein